MHEKFYLVIQTDLVLNSFSEYIHVRRIVKAFFEHEKFEALSLLERLEASDMMKNRKFSIIISEAY